MNLEHFYNHWPLARAALERVFPKFSFPDTPPDPADLTLALEGLAVMMELTPAELVEHVTDVMLSTPPNLAEDQQKAA